MSRSLFPWPRTAISTASTLPLVIVASMLMFIPPSSADMPQDSGPPPGEKAAVRAPMPKPLPRTDNAGAAAVTWPAPAVADVDLVATQGALGSATPSRVKAAGMPVSVGPAEKALGGATQSASVVPALPDRVRVELLGRDATKAAGVDALVVRL